MGQSNWTETRLRLAEDMALQGFSAADIAEKLGIKSRGVVIKYLKLHSGVKLQGKQIGGSRRRPTLKERGIEEIKPFEGPRPARPARPPRPKLNQRAIKSAPPWRDQYQNTASKPTKLLDLKSDQCRFPCGDPREPGFHCCGAERVEDERIPYCKDHALICYVD